MLLIPSVFQLCLRVVAPEKHNLFSFRLALLLMYIFLTIIDPEYLSCGYLLHGCVCAFILSIHETKVCIHVCEAFFSSLGYFLMGSFIFLLKL